MSPTARPILQLEKQKPTKFCSMSNVCRVTQTNGPPESNKVKRISEHWAFYRSFHYDPTDSYTYIIIIIIIITFYGWQKSSLLLEYCGNNFSIKIEYDFCNQTISVICIPKFHYISCPNIHYVSLGLFYLRHSTCYDRIDFEKTHSWFHEMSVSLFYYSVILNISPTD